MSFSRAAMLFLGLTPAQTRAKGHAPLESCHFLDHRTFTVLLPTLNTRFSAARGYKL
jgi:hypothetical protein